MADGETGFGSKKNKGTVVGALPTPFVWVGEPDPFEVLPEHLIPPGELLDPDKAPPPPPSAPEKGAKQAAPLPPPSARPAAAVQFEPEARAPSVSAAAARAKPASVAESVKLPPPVEIKFDDEDPVPPPVRVPPKAAPKADPFDEKMKAQLARSQITAPPAVIMESVGVRYGNGPEIFQDVSLNLKQGSFHYLTGPSGAGKTTLLSLLYLAMRPSRGTIHMFGRPLADIKPENMPKQRRRIGAVFQDFRLIEHLTVHDNVALPLRLAGAPESMIARNVPGLLRWVGLGDHFDLHPSVLSGGEKQRVAIARAVVCQPALLVADEPTGNVDEATAFRLLHLFQELNRLGTTVIVATHNERIVRRFPYPRLHIADRRLRKLPAHSEDSFK